MSQHTPEPWSYANGDGHYDGAVVIIGGRMTPRSPLAHIRDICGDAEADARRIVACVNACKHYRTEDLEEVGENLSGVFADTRERCAELIAHRDELLAALKRAEPLVEQTVDISGYKTNGNRRVWRAVRAAIAKCEAEK